MSNKDLLQRIREQVRQDFVGSEDSLNLMLTALVCGGHVLIEDVPGLGKTTLVSSFAKTLGLSFARIQFTPDVLPADITGYTLYNIATGEKEVHRGPVFHQVLLADEINRTGPKTQSSLLEAMQERQVTIDGVSYPLPDPFMVLATQNPADLAGTFPLPEAQLDRFLMRISLGYPSHSDEREILERGMRQVTPAQLEPVMVPEDLEALRAEYAEVHCSQALVDYIINLADATRHHPQISLGISPRGSLALLNACRAYAMIRGRDYVQPDDVQQILEPVWVHRLVLQSQALFKQLTPALVLREIMRELPIPSTF